MGKKLVVGLDGSQGAQRAAQYAATLAGPLGAELVLVHVVPSLALPAGAIGFAEQLLQAHRLRGEALLDTSLNALSRPDLTVTKRLVDAGSPADVLGEVATELGAEMIVVGSTGLGTVTRFLLGSAATRLAHSSPVPVLIVR